ncbi:uncharacterized protein LOC121323541 [Polyodon spathula]|uniref:uncharacterized protein LOC121322858 n=1 Tax=Polyodon spathula TaxID=7913 RepID=UPI001B7DCDD9|nr:uncharacterized protein LOC121322858 [Polyodon spathula]XP_041120415.1 uncharacterized protein LOC121323419 [Polyodon spathula]XP_041120589.1 uncharacterized protein LOC121323541 [Polyodon spathula]
MEIIKKHKVELTGVLSADPSPVVQLAHSRGIITDREYIKMKSITDPEERVIELLDRVSTKSDQTSQDFLDILREVHDTYPRLKDLFTDAEESDSSFSAAAQDTPIGNYCRVVSDAEKIKKADSIVRDKLQFFKTNRADLVQKVKNISLLIDRLHQTFHKEALDCVLSKDLPQDKMRKLLEFTTTESVAKEVFLALCNVENCVMCEILKI